MNLNQEKILGLDPGFGKTGYAVVSGSKQAPGLETHGLIVTSSYLSQARRLKEIIDNIEQVINQFNPTRVALEKVFFSANTKTALPVGEARGALLVVLENYRLPIVEYTPPQVKLAVTGDGRADKKQIQKMLQLIFRLDNPIKSDDAADAVAVALCALNNINFTQLK